jgi:hypothetical protein
MRAICSLATCSSASTLRTRTATSGNDGNSTLPLDTSLASSLTNANAAAESAAGAAVSSFFIMLELTMLATIGRRP